MIFAFDQQGYADWGGSTHITDLRVLPISSQLRRVERIQRKQTLESKHVQTNFEQENPQKTVVTISETSPVTSHATKSPCDLVYSAKKNLMCGSSLTTIYQTTVSVSEARGYTSVGYCRSVRI